MNDNVKKVFEMLGVEPNEKFKIIDTKRNFSYGEDYHLDDKLRLFVNECIEIRFDVSNLISNVFQIIKLPKEKTFHELMNWKPKIDEEYHFLDMLNIIHSYVNREKDFDLNIIKYTKVYPMESMAERRKEVQDKYEELGHQFTIKEWQDSDMRKWTLLINHGARRVENDPGYNYGYSKYGFISEELGKRFIQFLGETEQEQYENACLYL